MSLPIRRIEDSVGASRSYIRKEEDGILDSWIYIIAATLND